MDNIIRSGLYLCILVFCSASIRAQNWEQVGAHGSNHASIDMSHLAPGVYIGKLQTTTDANFSFKWIKQ